MSKWSDGSDRACTDFTKFANLQKDKLGYLWLMIDGHCLFRSVVLLLEHWNSQGLAGTRRDSQELAGNTLPFCCPLIGTLELAGTRRNSQGTLELAGTRRDSQELWNSRTLVLCCCLAAWPG